MTEATCKEEYANKWDEYINQLKIPMNEIKDVKNREEFAEAISTIRRLIVENSKTLDYE